MCAQGLGHMMQQADIGNIIQAAFCHQPGFYQQFFCMLYACFGKGDRTCLFIQFKISLCQRADQAIYGHI